MYDSTASRQLLEGPTPTHHEGCGFTVPVMCHCDNLIFTDPKFDLFHYYTGLPLHYFNPICFELIEPPVILNILFYHARGGNGEYHETF